VQKFSLVFVTQGGKEDKEGGVLHMIGSSPFVTENENLIAFSLYNGIQSSQTGRL